MGAGKRRGLEAAWENERELIAMLAERGCKRGAEIGVHTGRHAGWCVDAMPDLEAFYLVDPWDGRSLTTRYDQEAILAKARAAVAAIGEHAVFIREASPSAARFIEDVSLDWAYIDGNHRARAVKRDIIAWEGKVRPGGILCGHDFVDKGRKFGVKHVVLERYGDIVQDTGGPWPSWWVEV